MQEKIPHLFPERVADAELVRAKKKLSSRIAKTCPMGILVVVDLVDDQQGATPRRVPDGSPFCENRLAGDRWQPIAANGEGAHSIVGGSRQSLPRPPHPVRAPYGDIYRNPTLDQF